MLDVCECLNVYQLQILDVLSITDTRCMCVSVLMSGCVSGCV